MKTMEAEIITIGTELLLGELIDTNTRKIAYALRDIGLDLYRTSTVGDNAERIAQAIRESISRAQVVITTGGLGPTVDDATREGVALAFGVPTEYQPELWEQIQERFERFGRTPTENNRRQAFIPRGATAIENPIGTAPGFMMDEEEGVVIALPGVPAEMQYLLESVVLPFLRQRLKLNETIKTRLLRTSGVGESWLDDHIHDLERLHNPTVGLAAHPGRVDIRITAKAETSEEAESMIEQISSTIHDRLGDAIYGIDDASLEKVALDSVTEHGWRLAILESGTGGVIAAGFSDQGSSFAGGQVLPHADLARDLGKALSDLQEELSAQVGLALTLRTEGERHIADVILRTPYGEERLERSYGGPPTYAAVWALSLAANLIRRRLS
ncbi:MAG TPA: CinA family nicotinamide mononucleotide deamidase-related protein [Anaerolineae bacterium]|nr:CinA family nicotinamide mononucleotide deamidase-related protein [Anaerolineae bacterium]